MGESSDRDVRITHFFDQPPASVFGAWTDADSVAKWWAPDGLEIPRDSVEIEPHVGGRFHLTMVESGGGASYPYRAEIVEIAEPELIVLKAEAIPQAGIAESITRITFEAEGEGTRMTVTAGPYTEAMYENARAGWVALMANLEDLLRR